MPEPDLHPLKDGTIPHTSRSLFRGVLNYNTPFFEDGKISLIPDAHLSEHSHLGTWGAMLGFVVMMTLDVALG